MRWVAGLAWGLIVLGVLPFGGLALMAVIAGLGGCRVYEGYAQPCLIGGQDWGPTLQALGASGWALMVTLPVALLGVGMLIVLALVRARRRARR